MRGLKTQETKAFEAFFSIVQNAAERMNKVFFLEAGDGREIVTDTVEGEDLQGWLVPASDADAFEKRWVNDDVDDDMNAFFTFAIWKRKGKDIEISFEAS